MIEVQSLYYYNFAIHVNGGYKKQVKKKKRSITGNTRNIQEFENITRNGLDSRFHSHLLPFLNG